MTKEKRNKAKFWCHNCGMIGFRNSMDAEAVAREHGRKRVDVCPLGNGWHVR